MRENTDTLGIGDHNVGNYSGAYGIRLVGRLRHELRAKRIRML